LQKRQKQKLKNSFFIISADPGIHFYKIKAFKKLEAFFMQVNFIIVRAPKGLGFTFQSF
jgi:hypothetical protein